MVLRTPVSVFRTRLGVPGSKGPCETSLQNEAVVPLLPAYRLQEANRIYRSGPGFG